MGGARREHLYGEIGVDAHASRMVRTGRHKLVWYPTGNHLQLFDLEEDPDELPPYVVDRQSYMPRARQRECDLGSRVEGIGPRRVEFELERGLDVRSGDGAGSDLNITPRRGK